MLDWAACDTEDPRFGLGIVARLVADLAKQVRSTSVEGEALSVSSSPSANSQERPASDCGGLCAHHMSHVIRGGQAVGDWVGGGGPLAASLTAPRRVVSRHHDTLCSGLRFGC